MGTPSHVYWITGAPAATSGKAFAKQMAKTLASLPGDGWHWDPATSHVITEKGKKFFYHAAGAKHAVARRRT